MRVFLTNKIRSVVFIQLHTLGASYSVKIIIVITYKVFKYVWVLT